MVPFVDIAGSGQGNTTITGTNVQGLSGTVHGANNAELRDLTVKNTGVATGDFSQARAIYSSEKDETFRVSRVTAIVSGNATINTGIFNDYFSSPTFTQVTVKVSGGGTSNAGITNLEASPRLNDVTIDVNGAGSDIATGIDNVDSATVITRATISVKGDLSYGIVSIGAADNTVVRYSAITAGTAAVYAHADGNISIVSSDLPDFSVKLDTGGAVNCRGVTTASDFHAETCPMVIALP